MPFSDKDTCYLLLYVNEDFRRMVENILTENWPEEILECGQVAGVVIKNKIKEVR